MGTWRRIDGNRRFAQLADLHLSERGVFREGFPGRIICMPPDPFALIHHRWNSISRMRALQRTLPGLFYRHHSSVFTGKEKRNTQSIFPRTAGCAVPTMVGRWVKLIHQRHSKTPLSISNHEHHTLDNRVWNGIGDVNCTGDLV